MTSHQTTRTDHLAKAKDYIAKGEDYYRRAAEEIVAAIQEARKEGRELSYVEIGRRIGRSDQYARRLVQAHTNSTRASGDFTVDWNSGSNKRDQVTASTLAKADDGQVKEIVAALPIEAVERVMHAATSDLGRRDRPVREHRPVGKSLFQRFAEHCFTGWKLQDEMQDSPPPTGDELIRFRAIAEANLAFAQVILKWLETGDFDAEIAELLAEARESA